MTELAEETDIRRLKISLVRAIYYAAEAAGLEHDEAKFLQSIGYRRSWMAEAAGHKDVPLQEYIAVYDAVAELAGWRSMAKIVRAAAYLQRHDEWPAGAQDD